MAATAAAAADTAALIAAATVPRAAALQFRTCLEMIEAVGSLPHLLSKLGRGHFRWLFRHGGHPLTVTAPAPTDAALQSLWASFRKVEAF